MPAPHEYSLEIEVRSVSVTTVDSAANAIISLVSHRRSTGPSALTPHISIFTGLSTTKKAKVHRRLIIVKDANTEDVEKINVSILPSLIELRFKVV